MANTDYYQTLEVSKTATADEIKKAYRRLSRKYHPDMNPDDKQAEANFKAVQQAFDVLGDEQKRRQYDQFGEAFNRRGPQGEGQTWTSGQGGFDFNDLFGGQVDLGDLFGGAFGGGGRGQTRQRRRQTPGRDLEIGISIPFQIAVNGGEYPLSLQRGGQTERIMVKIPPGVDEGSRVRLAGQGEPSTTGGPAGDLHLKLQIIPHPYFRRDGNNLLIDMPLSITEAILGAQVEVPTLAEGMVSLKVPPGTSSGAKLRLKGKGIVDRKTKEQGDQLVVIKIVSPKEITPAARELLDKLELELKQDPRRDLWK